MNWKILSSLEQLEEVISSSRDKPQVIFKHSTRCYISRAVKSNFENEWHGLDDLVDLFYLDLLEHRDVSNAIMDKLSVQHQSPQIILIKNDKAVYHASHDSIVADDLKGALH